MNLPVISLLSRLLLFVLAVGLTIVLLAYSIVLTSHTMPTQCLLSM